MAPPSILPWQLVLVVWILAGIVGCCIGAWLVLNGVV